MAPRYIAFDDQLPKTPTQKVEKFKLKSLGIGSALFDAESGTPSVQASSIRLSARQR